MSAEKPKHDHCREENTKWIELALRTLKFNQKQLAMKLKVSETQITKWKQGESMAYEREEAIRKLIGTDEMFPDLILACGSVEAAKKWRKLIEYLGVKADESAQDEDGYGPSNLAYPDADDFEDCGSVFDVLTDMGVEWPKTFPAELDFDYAILDDFSWKDAETEEECEKGQKEHTNLWDTFYNNPYVDLIHSIFKKHTDVYAFFETPEFSNFWSAILELQTDTEDSASQAHSCLLYLSAAKLHYSDVPGVLVTQHRFEKFQRKWTDTYVRWLGNMKRDAYENKIPVTVEVMRLVSESAGMLGSAAELSGIMGSFGSEQPLHPDIYMNELLQGVRMLNQAVPFIMKHLGILEQFELDRTELSIQTDPVRLQREEREGRAAGEAKMEIIYARNRANNTRHLFGEATKKAWSITDPESIKQAMIKAMNQAGAHRFVEGFEKSGCVITEETKKTLTAEEVELWTAVDELYTRTIRAAQGICTKCGEKLPDVTPETWNEMTCTKCGAQYKGQN